MEHRIIRPAGSMRSIFAVLALVLSVLVLAPGSVGARPVPPGTSWTNYPNLNLNTGIAGQDQATGEIPASPALTSLANIEAAFNNARAIENQNLCPGGVCEPNAAVMPTNLSFPPGYAGWTPSEKGLFLLNSERVARGLLPFQGVDPAVVTVAQAWAQTIVGPPRAFAHNPNAFAEIVAACNGCNGNMGLFPAENLYARSRFALPNRAILDEFGIEVAIYTWMYVDANDGGSGWGHRYALLWNDQSNDHGSAASEGFVGFGIAKGDDECCGGFLGEYEAVVFNAIDTNANYPAAPATCNGLAVTVDIGAGGTPTPGPDVILGTPSADVINALGGNDVVCGLGGDDTINGGPGNDTIFGGDGNDTIFGSDGDDTIDGEAGNDTIQGNAGADVVSGGADDDIVSGSEGDDTVNGNDGTDTLYGGGDAGIDTINGGAGNDTILAGPGNDIIDGGADNDLISGNAGNDTINGGDGADFIYGVDGADTLHGDGGNDTILGGLGNDIINGGDGNDALSGNQDDDTINAGNGDDTIYGVDGNDTLNGNAGNDTILGGNGNDIIDGGTDNDLLSGNAGADTVNGGSGNDEVFGADGNDILDGGFGIDIILGGNNDDQITSLDGQADQVSGSAGTDTCTPDVGVDTVFSCEIIIGVGAT